MLEFEDGAALLRRRVLGIDPGASGANAALDEGGDLLGCSTCASKRARRGLRSGPLDSDVPRGSCPRDSKLDQLWIPGEARRTTVSK
jgi:hypothetical protein